MSTRQFIMVVIVLVWLVGFTGVVQAQLPEPVGWWLFDEGQGTVAADISGNGYDGAIVGATWTEGQYGSALEFAGGAGVEIPPAVFDNISLQCSMTFWAFGADALPSQTVVFRAANDGGNRQWGSHLPWSNGQVYLDTGATGGGATYDRVNGALDSSLWQGNWTHWGFVKNADTGELSVYANGEIVLTEATGNTRPIVGVTAFTVGSNVGGGNPYTGILDDVRLYDQALSAEQIQETMLKAVFGPAGSPKPANGATDVLRDVTLSWSAGEFAATRNVYFGLSSEDVNDGNAAALVGDNITETTLDVGILDYGQTYFWRVDEVNGAPDNTVFKGEVWSFEVEPLAIPVETLTAMASSSNAGNMGPENTINGVGLNELDQHSTEPTEMWLSGMGDLTPSIQYEFDKPYKLHEMLVWNSNQVIESFVGIGAKDVVVEYSLDGVEWTVLEGATLLAQAPGNATYTANTAFAFGGVMAQHVKTTITAGYGMLPQYGISAVRFLYIPTFAREAQPADGDITAAANVQLSWRAGREAVSHQVNLGTDAADLPLVGTTSDSSYAANALNYSTTYYWQIIEVNEAQTPTTHAGPIWSFTTPDFGTVDDFEGYDDDCNRIFFGWLDGIGHNGEEECGIAPYNGNGTGSIVGNDVAPFAEEGIVHGGSQAMPFLYDSGMSEATLSFAAQDWTASGVQSLSLYFHGVAGNTGQLYVKINNTKVVYDGAAADLASGPWKPWNIDLTAVGGNLQNVTSLTIGVENTSAPGTLYIDDILLYPQAVEFVTPVEPDAANLLAHYAFDGDFSDSANNFDGTALGQAQIVSDPARGQVLSLDGDDDAVDIPTMGESPEITISVWVNVADMITPSDWKSTFHGDAWTAGDVHWRILNNRVDGGINGASGGNLTGTADIPYEQWNHVALTMSPTEFAYYVNGHNDVTRTLTAAPTLQMGDGLIGAWLNGENVEREFAGMLDDFRIYDRALTLAELLWLAGNTDPVAKPF